MNSQAPSGEDRKPTSARKVPAAEDPDQTAALLRLLQLEADVRQIETVREIVYHLANESRGVLSFRQAFVFQRKRVWKLAAVSSVSAFDAQAPLNRAVCRLVSTLETSDGARATCIDLTDDSNSDALRDHSFPCALWVPMKTRAGFTFAGVLLLRENPWPETFIPLAERVVSTYGHAWEAVAGRKLGRGFVLPRRVVWPVTAIAILAIGFIQAPLTVLAPAEVTGRDRITVAAALNGVVESVVVPPNSFVEEGAVLAHYDDTELRNALEIADQEATVAQAQLEKFQSASFTDRAAARELKVAQADLELALAESTLARERLSNVQVRAPRSGLAVFSDARELIGRPVSVGERLMEIVSPEVLEFTVRLPVNDSIVLKDGTFARVFLDSSPLTPIPGALTRRSYRATAQEDGSFAYTLTVSAASEDLSTARIGAQGTAQLFGDRHSLFFIVFRRPFSWLRQRFGI